MALHFDECVSLVVLVLSGSAIVILLTKVDRTMAVGIYGIKHTFFHPFNEMFIAFIGQVFCIPCYFIFYLYFKSKDIENTHTLTRGTRKLHFRAMILPTLFSIMGTSMHLYGLAFTDATSFQIFRGTVLIFTPIFSRFILKSTLASYQIVAMLIMVVGLLFFGFADCISSIKQDSSVSDYQPFGNSIIVVGQLFLSLQMVWEEQHMRKHDYPPLLYSGCHGLIGTVIAGILLIPLQFIPQPFIHRPRKVMEDSIDAYLQLKNSTALKISCGIYMALNTTYYFCLFYGTKQVNSTTTVIFIAAKTIIVWMYEITINNAAVHPVQLLGFATFVCGICAYNNIIEKVHFRHHHTHTHTHKK